MLVPIATYQVVFYFFFFFFFFFFNDTATTEIYTLSLHDALPISAGASPRESKKKKESEDDKKPGQPMWGELHVTLWEIGRAHV